jgi:hypothetical protein
VPKDRLRSPALDVGRADGSVVEGVLVLPVLVVAVASGVGCTHAADQWLEVRDTVSQAIILLSPAVLTVIGD